MDEYCIVKQRAGPLVKVFSTDRACFLRKNGECIRSRCGPAMSRTTVDKLELRLALFGYDGVFHSLPTRRASRSALPWTSNATATARSLRSRATENMDKSNWEETGDE